MVYPKKLVVYPDKESRPVSAEYTMAYEDGGLWQFEGHASVVREAVRRWNEYEKLKRDILLLLEATKIIADSSELAWPERSCVLTEVERIATEAAKQPE